MSVIPMEISCANSEFFCGSCPPSCLQSQGSFQTSAWRPYSKMATGMEAYIQLWGRYPTPPYLTVRENFTKTIVLTVNRRQLLDIKRKITPMIGALRYDREKQEITSVASFRPDRSPEPCTLYSNNRSLTEECGTLKVVSHKSGIGGQCEFEIIPYKTTTSTKQGVPVVIKTKNLCLSCPKSSSPKLQLEEFSKELENISGESERFIFWQNKSGSNVTFQSQTNDNFFIATSKDKQDVGMVNDKNSKGIIEFEVYGCNSKIQAKILKIIEIYL
uniref:Interleukin-1 n=1 Tax=Geotrypetes seraphini TaxID=260995 RepID=A0A6P8R001_GEOSA|nr:uncharacterized protein LOC117362012 [Geotrypetes seraphini]